MPDLQLITPDWPAPKNVRAIFTTRHGGVSTGAYAALNLAKHVGDDLALVLKNRALLAEQLPMEPLWLEQVHGATVVNAACTCPDAQADAAVARMPYRICTVMTADCLPVLFCDTQGTAVAATHAGWKGLAAGVLENSVKAMQARADTLMAWLGPAISQPAFEVGEEVRTAFVAHLPEAEAAFVSGKAPGKWQADLYLLARQRLAAIGVTQVYGGDRCTFTETADFFSARRDGTQTGRQASLIWLE
ncbi:peptidoglycan editing factor PgeF [Uliginosibacterium sp. 31-16]|uniref:peptidoglycan editing factor PgeF n=1 Tax=Uliginosibacterium sp. 31-16 TaxID=3068315 RepID=UPI00273DD06D|nr:peptidoglycan editing factor PgeF [Uliginosibacterium sp. 31-16]MDP5237892.1 peptidoglycan editing factor PgeF [Uliginosibacterium sp. 31-16]